MILGYLFFRISCRERLGVVFVILFSIGIICVVFLYYVLVRMSIVMGVFSCFSVLSVLGVSWVVLLRWFMWVWLRFV